MNNVLPYSKIGLTKAEYIVDLLIDLISPFLSLLKMRGCDQVLISSPDHKELITYIESQCKVLNTVRYDWRLANLLI